MSAAQDAMALTGALVETGSHLRERGYAFTTPTPATHANVLAREPHAQARTLRDVFGWNRPFAPDILPPALFGALQAAGLVEPHGALWRSRIRFSTLEGLLFAHGGYPTTARDAVFFGPDTYRFARLIRHELQTRALSAGARIVDIGCGAGPGGLVALHASPGASLFLSDINPSALQFASANAALNGLQATFTEGDLYAPLEGRFDLVVANPPYLNDAGERTYRHGGGRFGEALSHRIVREGLPLLAAGGRLVLYTGSAITADNDPIRDPLRAELDAGGWRWRYEELDPDVFGEELALPGYDGVERIAAVALVVERDGA